MVAISNVILRKYFHLSKSKNKTCNSQLISQLPLEDALVIGETQDLKQAECYSQMLRIWQLGATTDNMWTFVQLLFSEKANS